MDPRRSSYKELQTAFHQARNVSKSSVGSTILGRNAARERALTNELKALDKARQMELKQLKREQNLLAKGRSPSVEINVFAPIDDVNDRLSTPARRQNSLDAIATPRTSRRYGSVSDIELSRSTSLPRLRSPIGSPRAFTKRDTLPGALALAASPLPPIGGSLRSESPLVPSRKERSLSPDIDVEKKGRSNSLFIQKGDYKSDPRFQKFEEFLKMATAADKKKKNDFLDF